MIPSSSAPTVSSNKALYVNAGYPSLATVQDALDLLLYAPMAITSFFASASSPSLNSGNILEIGQTLTALTLSWSLNKTAVTQVVNPGTHSVTPGTTSYAYNGLSYTSNQTFSLTADDGTTNSGHVTTAYLTVSFESRFYFGTSAASAPTSSQIVALSNNPFATSRNLTTSFAGNGNYVVFAYPASFGTATIKVNGLTNTAFNQTTVSVTNASGAVVSYYCYTSQTVYNGSGVINFQIQ